MRLATENGSLSCGQVYRDGEAQIIATTLGSHTLLTITSKKTIYFKDNTKCRSEPYGELLKKQFLKNIHGNCSQPCIRPTFCEILHEGIHQLPVCKDEEEKMCFDHVLEKTQNSIMVQPCTKVQYKFKHRVGKFKESKDKNKVAFHMTFDPPNVHVDDEYLIYDLLAVIRSIGGTMGFCIGFSFSNIASLTLKLVEKVGNRLTTERRKIQDNHLLVVSSKKNGLPQSEDNTSSMAKLEDRTDNHMQLISRLEEQMIKYEERLRVVESQKL